MDNKSEPNQKFKWHLYIRTDSHSAIHAQQILNYQVTPAEHMNLSPMSSQAYINSGYLSTFEYAKGQGLDAVLNYGAYNNVHFIFLPETICETHFLTGGTRGLEKDDENNTIFPKKAEGSAWDLPVFNTLIPQIFFTSNMEVELGSMVTRGLQEVLLGGNWSDYAQIITLSKQKVQEIRSQFTGDEVALYKALTTYTIPYINTSKTEQQLSYDTQLDRAHNIAWWQTLKQEEKRMIGFVHSIIHHTIYHEPLLTDHNYLSALASISAYKNKLESEYPLIKNYFQAAQETQDLLLQLASFYTMYHHPQQLLFNQLNKFITANSLWDNQLLTNECNKLQVYNQRLSSELRFWITYKNFEALNLSEEEIRLHFPEIVYFVQRIETSQKNASTVLNLLEDSNIFDELAQLDLNTTDRKVKAIKIQRSILGSQKIVHQFCDELNIFRTPVNYLALWFKNFHDTYAIPYILHRNNYEEIFNIGITLEKMYKSLDNIRKELIFLIQELDKIKAENFLLQITKSVSVAINNINEQMIKKNDPIGSGKEMIEIFSTVSTLLSFTRTRIDTHRFVTQNEKKIEEEAWHKLSAYSASSLNSQALRC
ncbi:hypothetical protein [Legionella bozemanae]|uniref:Uncharacterized protein n=1 Tax=Legionella bozemanae TaxID=447 RepID=A0A0W0R6R6_LEGBO|nr:hypothetical protein [Legionella bozemanae]KTC66732.1 hypothetical protein Lboz_3627 [Legionella bozemanae]STO34642.1 Uncharacterised protein [Legionella bozemanae]